MKLDLEGRPDDEPMTEEELREIARVVDAFDQVVSAMRAARTVGDCRRVEALVDMLDQELDQ